MKNEANTINLIFFLLRLYFTDIGNTQGGRGRERNIFIPLYHFDSFTKIQTFIWNFASDMIATYFNHIVYNYQAATR